DFTPDGFQNALINYEPKQSAVYRIIVSCADSPLNPAGPWYYNLHVRVLDPKEPTPTKYIRFLNPGGTITKADKVDPLRPGCGHQVHTFQATAGDKYAISMVPGTVGLGLAPYIRLEDPDGKKLAEDDDRDDVESPLIVFKAEKTGRHRVVV